MIGGAVTFGMGFAANLNDPGETLYVASDDLSDGGKPEFLGAIDVQSFTLKTIGQFPKKIGSAELTGTGNGRLFGFGVDQTMPGTTTYRLLEFDTSNAGILSDLPLQMPTGTQPIQAWAFAFWGGDFYFFTSLQTQQHASNISRYTPQPGDTSANAELILQVPNTIVGAGVSTCAPQQQ
jgi:hypothetical protein